LILPVIFYPFCYFLHIKKLLTRSTSLLQQLVSFRTALQARTEATTFGHFSQSQPALVSHFLKIPLT